MNQLWEKLPTESELEYIGEREFLTLKYDCYQLRISLKGIYFKGFTLSVPKGFDMDRDLALEAVILIYLVCGSNFRTDFKELIHVESWSEATDLDDLGCQLGRKALEVYNQIVYYLDRD